jgi:translation initiation factor 5B
LIGFDASGHIAEETKNASYVAARGIILGAVATAFCGFTLTILFLFCLPDLDTLFTLAAPQPFILVYSMALGRGASVFMTVLAVVGLILVRYLTRASLQRLTVLSEHQHRDCCRIAPCLRCCS